MAVITLSGEIGSGKSTVAPLIADALGYAHIHTGGIFREMAKEHGMDIEQFYASRANDPELEKSVDARQLDVMRKGNVVIQGRVAFHFANQLKPRETVINIFLAVDPVVGAERKIKEGVYASKTTEEVVKIQQARHADERSHYRALYSIEGHLDPAQFDIVCDTTNHTPNEVVELLLKEIKARI